ncbi:glutaminase [Verrucomicrobiaceae bacterium 227]
MNYQTILEKIRKQVRSEKPGGEVATYIPELAKVPPEKFGIHLTTLAGENFASGESEERFSTQSISKVFLLTRVVQEIGKKLRKRVGVEPSGSLFNSLVLLEYERGIPRNPFINAGALVVCDILISLLPDPKADFLNFVRRLAGSDDLSYDRKVVESEIALSYRNRAILNMMKGFGNIENDAETVLEFYITACAVSMNCRELAQAFGVFANGGKTIDKGEAILTERQAKRINAIMLTCGLYDEAGEFAFRVGLAAKSGVGGGIAAVHPGKYAVAVWSPPLNPKGNSHAGFRALELLTDATESSIF